jgi:hypothetical protein
MPAYQRYRYPTKTGKRWVRALFKPWRCPWLQLPNRGMGCASRQHHWHLLADRFRQSPQNVFVSILLFGVFLNHSDEHSEVKTMGYYTWILTTRCIEVERHTNSWFRLILSTTLLHPLTPLQSVLRRMQWLIYASTRCLKTNTTLVKQS